MCDTCFDALIQNPKNIRDIIKSGLNLLAMDNPNEYKISGCIDCEDCYHETDGDYGEIDCGWYCSKFENYTWLNSFPFKKIMPCFQANDCFGNSFYFWHGYLCDLFDWDNIEQIHIPKNSWFTEELRSKVMKWYLRKERRKQGEHIWDCQADCKHCSFRNEECMSRNHRTITHEFANERLVK